MSENSDFAPLSFILERITNITSTLKANAPADHTSSKGLADLKKLSGMAKQALDSPPEGDERYLDLARIVGTSAIAFATSGIKFTHPDDEDRRSQLTALGVDLIEAAAAVAKKLRKRQTFGLQAFQARDDDAELKWRARERQLLQAVKKAESITADLRLELEGLAEIAKAEIDKITQAYEDAQADIKAKTDDINRVTGQAAARMIAGDYEGSAAAEKKSADDLRIGALIFMGLIVLVLGWAVVETASASFEWSKFLSRISLVFLLGVPATYLARESAKHREQQYHHLQTSLDMKAISPFLASLPDEEQHKLKVDIASRIFGGRDFSKVSNDPYPLNTHEIIMKLIDKVDFAGKPDKEQAKPSTAQAKKPAEGASAAPAEAANP